MTSSTMPLFDFLPLAVPRIEVLRQRHGLVQISGQQQAQGFLGGFQPAGGVEARRELKADFVRAEFFRRLRDFFQSDESRAVASGSIARKPAETRMRFSPVSGTRSAIVPSATRSSSGRKSNSAAPGRLVSRPRLTRACASLNARPAEQSSVQAGPATSDVLTGETPVRRCGFTSATASGARIGNLMMVQNNHVHAAVAKPGDGFHGSRTTIHGEQQRDVGNFFRQFSTPSALRP